MACVNSGVSLIFFAHDFKSAIRFFKSHFQDLGVLHRGRFQEIERNVNVGIVGGGGIFQQNVPFFLNYQDLFCCDNFVDLA